MYAVTVNDTQGKDAETVNNTMDVEMPENDTKGKNGEDMQINVVKSEKTSNFYDHQDDNISVSTVDTKTLYNMGPEFETIPANSDLNGAYLNQFIDENVFSETFSTPSFMTEHCITANGHNIGRFLGGRINKTKTTFDIMYPNGLVQTCQFNVKVKYQQQRVSLYRDPIIKNYFRNHLANEDFLELYGPDF